MSVVKPMLRYPGGKTRIADWIVSHMPPLRGRDVTRVPVLAAISSMMFGNEKAATGANR